MANFIFSAFCDESGESTIKGQMNACKRNGITHMELRGFGKELNINNMTTEQAKAMKEEIDAAGMSVASIGSHYGKINIKDEFEPHFEAFKNTIEVAKILEAKYIRIFSFYFDKEDIFEEHRAEVIKRVKLMTDYALANSIIPCHENEKDIYGDIAERCLDILEACDGRLKAVFDPANFIQCGEDTLKAYEMLEEHIEYLHIKDALYKNGHVVPAGKGEGNVEEIIRRISKQNRDIILSLEPHLQVFEGLGNLEKSNSTLEAMNEYSYPSHSESFKAAADAMHGIVEAL